MSKEQPEEADANNASGNSEEESDDNVNLFTSVWVKIEVDDENEIEIKNEEVRENVREQKKPRKSSKRPAPRKNLKCDLCDYKTGYKNCLAIHILGHSSDKPFICGQCDYKTKYPISLKRHIEYKHGLEPKTSLRTYKCELCDYTSHFKGNLTLHKRKHDLEKQFKCAQCSYCTAYKHNIIKHSRKHRKTEESTYCCDKCPFTTKFEGHITRHLAKVHFEVSERASRCEHCTFSTKTGWRLNVHRKRSHQEKAIKCIRCNYETMYRCAFREHKLTHIGSPNNQSWYESLFSDTNTTEQILEMKMSEMRSKIDVESNNESDKIYNELKSKFEDQCCNRDGQPVQSSEHEKNNHYLVDPTCEVSWSNIQVIEYPDQDRPFQCITCNYNSKFKASVQRHFQRLHTSHNRPYKCIHCDFSTKTKDQIGLHNKRSKSVEILTCKICAFSSLFKCQFAMHEKEHNPFKCIHCEYTCKKKPDIQKHFTTVHLSKGLQLQCKHCDYKTSRKESLLSHEVIHTGKKPFQCQHCDYMSMRRSLLENHLNRVHKTNMIEKIIDDSKIQSLKKKTVVNECIEDEDYYYTGSTDPVTNL